ncbi:MAG: NAD-dependent epimerase [Phycisphaerae bacterium]
MESRGTLLTMPGELKRVVIAGGSGVLGRLLGRHLVSRGARVTVLTRSGGGDEAFERVAWDGRTLGGWSACLEGASGLVNLCGRSVDCIKSPDHCDEILRSRVESTRVLGEAMRRACAPPPVWVQMSTAHIYGDPPRARCDESSALGYGLAPTVGRAWEEAFCAALPPGVRGVVLSTGFVLAKEGGALKKLGMLARLGLGGTVGAGDQGMSWIHAGDLNRIFERALRHPGMAGVYVASSPRPVSNREFMRELRRAAGVPFGLPAPEWIVRLASRVLLRTDPDLALYGRYVVPVRLAEEGFEFEYGEIGGALDAIYRSSAG